MKAVQVLHYSQGTQCCTGLALYKRMYRPFTIRRAVQVLYSAQGCIAPVLYAGLYRPCTICRDL